MENRKPKKEERIERTRTAKHNWTNIKTKGRP